MYEDDFRYDFDHERPTLLTHAIDWLFTVLLASQPLVPILIGALLFWLTPLSDHEKWSALHWYVGAFALIIMVCRVDEARRFRGVVLSWREMGMLIPCGFCFALISPIIPYAAGLLSLVLLFGVWFAYQVRKTVHPERLPQTPQSV